MYVPPHTQPHPISLFSRRPYRSRLIFHLLLFFNFSLVVYDNDTRRRNSHHHSLTSIHFHSFKTRFPSSLYSISNFKEGSFLFARVPSSSPILHPPSLCVYIYITLELWLWRLICERNV